MNCKAMVLIILIGVSMLGAQEELPNDMLAMIQQGKTLFSEGKFDACLVLLDQALTRFPSYRYEILGWKLQALRALNRQEEVEKVAQELQLLFKESLGVGKPVKLFTRQVMNGREVSLQQYRGKVVLIDFWATTCRPCIKELPDLKKLYADYHDQGFEIISISIDRTKDEAARFTVDNGMVWTHILSEKFWQDETALLYKVRATPATLLVDREGILRYAQVRGADLRNAVAELIAK